MGLDPLKNTYDTPITDSLQSTGENIRVVGEDGESRGRGNREG